MYKHRFCVKTAPYFISYATYASATIHVRIAAQQIVGSEAHSRLQNCLYALAEQQINCYGPRQTMRILKGLVRRLDVRVRDVSEIEGEDCTRSSDMARHTNHRTDTQSNPDVSQLEASDAEPFFTDLDIEQVMRSFDFESIHHNMQATETEGFTHRTDEIQSIFFRISCLGLIRLLRRKTAVLFGKPVVALRIC